MCDKCPLATLPSRLTRDTAIHYLISESQILRMLQERDPLITEHRLYAGPQIGHLCDNQNIDMLSFHHLCLNQETRQSVAD